MMSVDRQRIRVVTKSRAGSTRLGTVVDLATICLVIVAVVAFVRSQRPSTGGSDPYAAALDSGATVQSVEVRGKDTGLDTLFGPAEAGEHLVFIFRSDCPVCKRQKPIWNKLAATARSAGVQVIALTGEDANLPEVASYMDSVTILQATDASQIPSRLGTAYVPATMLVDGANHLVFEQVGLLDSLASEKWSARWVATRSGN